MATQHNPTADETLRTERLVLRAFGPGDAARLAELIGDFDVCGNLSRVPYPYSVEDARQWLADQRTVCEPAKTVFAITAPEGELMGATGFHPDNGHTVIGYWLGKPYWGQGYMTEASAAVLDWYFAATGEDSLNSGVFHFNAASLAIQRKLGFVVTGHSTRHNLARGEALDHVDTLLTREAFEAARRHLKVGDR